MRPCIGVIGIARRRPPRACSPQRAPRRGRARAAPARHGICRRGAPRLRNIIARRYRAWRAPWLSASRASSDGAAGRTFKRRVAVTPGWRSATWYGQAPALANFSARRRSPPSPIRAAATPAWRRRRARRRARRASLAGSIGFEPISYFRSTSRRRFPVPRSSRSRAADALCSYALATRSPCPAPSPIAWYSFGERTMARRIFASSPGSG